MSAAHEEQAFRTLKGLQRLGQQYGKVRLEAACHRANVFGMVGLRRIRAILATQLDNEPLLEPPQPPSVVEHANLRGPQYYR